MRSAKVKFLMREVNRRRYGLVIQKCSYPLHSPLSSICATKVVAASLLSATLYKDVLCSIHGLIDHTDIAHRSRL